MAFSSILGLLAIFAPSGLGVREGTLVYLLSYVMPGPVGVIISILTRLWMTFIEIGMIGMVYLLNQFKKAQKPDQKTISLRSQRKWQCFPFPHLIAFGLIAAIAFVAYSNTFYVPFHFDDRPNILYNPDILMTSLRFIPNCQTPAMGMMPHPDMYVQALENFTGVRIDMVNQKILFDLSRFYEKLYPAPQKAP